MMGVKDQILHMSKIINVVLTYWAISISMVFFNKHLVGGKWFRYLQINMSLKISIVQFLQDGEM